MNIKYSAVQIADKDNFGFSATEFSKFKYGANQIARKFGHQLASGFINNILKNKTINKSIVIVPSAYSHIRTASYYLTSHFKDKLNLYLFEQGLPPAEEAKIHRSVTYREDYGAMNAEQRLQLICNDKFHIDSTYLEEKILIFVDDIRITGTHEKIIEKMLHDFGVQNQCYMLYFAELTNMSINPNIEGYLNNYHVKTLDEVNHIIKHEDFAFNTRVVKFILNSTTADFVNFVKQQSKTFTDQLFFLALGNEFFKFEGYRENFDYLHKLVASTQHNEQPHRAAPAQ